MRLLRRLRRLRAEQGYSLVELVAVMLILATVLGGLTTVFVHSTRAEVRLNERVQAQLNATVALGKLRRDVHCASTITPAGASGSITLTLPSACSGGGTVTWCTAGSGTRYGLYRASGTTCNASSRQYADYLTSATVFTYTEPVLNTSLAKLHVDFPVNADGALQASTYRLVDDIVLRNSLRG